MNPNKSNTDSLTVLAAAVAGIIQIMSTPGRFTLSSVTIGTILLLILSTYHVTADRNKKELAGFSAVWALALVITVGWGIEMLNDWLVQRRYGVSKYASVPNELGETIMTFREAVQAVIWLLFSIGVYAVVYLKRRKAQAREAEILLLGKPD